jgi:Flp pilus assembly protein TadG
MTQNSAAKAKEELPMCAQDHTYSKNRTCRNAQRGASIVELAFITPALLLLLIGVIDMGRAYYLSIEVANAAFAGAQYGVSSQDTSLTDIQNAAKNDASDVPGISATATLGCECSNDAASAQSPCTTTPPTCSGNTLVQYVQVATTATYSPLFPWPELPTSFTLNGNAKLRLTE